ncbi:hypothetical protein LIER_14229 [Lithospermum erythrorhizon]|uniref:Uncharacterized protein n=1 Tax=Lithospermum erythrorhizon TaxID=34254 RepID=A0AAV3PZD6_LITER
MELEAIPLMDLSECVIGGAPSLGDDDDDDGYWSSLDSLNVDEITSIDKESNWSDGGRPENEKFEQNKVFLDFSNNSGNQLALRFTKNKDCSVFIHKCLSNYFSSPKWIWVVVPNNPKCYHENLILEL